MKRKFVAFVTDGRGKKIAIDTGGVDAVTINRPTKENQSLGISCRLSGRREMQPAAPGRAIFLHISYSWRFLNLCRI